MVVVDVFDVYQIEIFKGIIDFDGQWCWVSVYLGLLEKLGCEVIFDILLEELQFIVVEYEIEIDQFWEVGKVVMEFFGEFVELGFINFIFVCDYLVIVQLLVCLYCDDFCMVEVWDFIIGGMECGIGFFEFVDLVIQCEVFIK